MIVLEKRNPPKAVESASVRFAVTYEEFTKHSDRSFLMAALAEVHETETSIFGADVSRYQTVNSEYRVYVAMHKD